MSAPADSDAELADAAEVAQRVCVARLGHWDGQDAAQDVMERVCRRVRPLDTTAGRRDARAEVESVRGYATFLAGRYAPRYPGLHFIPVGVSDHIERCAGAGAEPGPNPEQQVLRAEETTAAAQQVAGLLASLPERERQVLVTSELGQRPTDETAAELGLSPSGVRSAHTRAMARMRAAVGVASPNPLASNRPAHERARDAAASRAAARGVDIPSQRHRLPAQTREAGLAAAAEGASVDELARRFGVSESTATRWRRGGSRSDDAEASDGDRRADPAPAPAPSIDELRHRVQEATRAVAHALAADQADEDAASAWRSNYRHDVDSDTDDVEMSAAAGGRR